MALPVNFQDDVLASSMNGKRRYNLITNSDGTVSLEDVTTYAQEGSNFGAGQINQTNGAVNTINNNVLDTIEAISANTDSGKFAGALALKNVNNNFVDKLQWYIDNGWLPEKPANGIAPASLNDCSWAAIKQLATSDTFKNYYKVGDTKTITLSSGEKVVMQVASINDGTGTAGAYYPKGTVDFISVDCLQTTYQMNSSNTNAGGWNSCALRKTLNSTIFQTLPSDVQSSIIEKIHYRSSGSQSTALTSSSDKLWLPTEYEIFGGITYSAGTENANYNNKYAIFTDAGSRIKHLGINGSAYNWWESSPSVSYSTHFCHVGSGGAVDASYVSYSFGLAICFRIG